MDIERIVVRLIADASVYNRVMDGAINTIKGTVSGIGQILSGMGKIAGTAFVAPFKTAAGLISAPFKVAAGAFNGAVQAARGLDRAFTMAQSGARMLTAGLTALRTGALGGGGGFVAGISSAFTTLHGAIRLFSAFGTAVQGVSSGLKTFASGVMGGVKSALSGITSTIRGVVEGLQGMASGFMTIVRTIASSGLEIGVAVIARLAISFADLAHQAITLASSYEQSAMAFGVMTGSMEKGKNLLDSLHALAIETPFTAEEIVPAAKQLKGFGFDTEDVIPIIRHLGDVAAGTGTDLMRITKAFGDVRIAGRLMGPELRQFTNAGIPLIENLAVVMGKPETAMRELVEAGEVSFGDVVRAFNRMTTGTGLYAGMMAKQAETVAGRWSALKETMQVTLRNIGLAFFKGFGLAGLLNELKEFTGGLGTNTEKLERFFNRVREVFDIIRAAGTAALRVFVDYLGRVGEQLGHLVPKWDDFKEAVVFVVRTLISGFGKLLEIIEQVKQVIVGNILRPIGDVLKSFADPAGNQVRITQPGENDYGAFFRILKGDLMENLAPEKAEKLKKLAEAAGGLGNVFHMMAGTIDKPIPDFAGQMLKEFDKIVAGQAKVPQDALGGLMGAAMGAATALDKTAQAAANLNAGMRVPEQLSAGAQKVLNEMIKKETEGRNPIEKFQKNIKNIEEAFWGPHGNPFKRTPNPIIGFPDVRNYSKMVNDVLFKGAHPGLMEQALMPDSPYAKGGSYGGMLAERDKALGIGAFKPMGGLTPEQYATASFEVFQDFQKEVAHMSEKLAPAAMRGSAEEMEIINKTNNQTANFQEEVLGLFKAAVEKQKQEDAIKARTLTALEKIAGIIQPPPQQGKIPPK
jgi:tape measure domain-containing protein